jgi:genome maintenance exonuclease 1
MNQFNFVKLPELDFDLVDETTEQGRLYKTPKGEKYPSITTVLSSYNKKEIMEWRKKVGEEQANKISGKARNRGTKLHSVCEKYLLNEMNDMSFRSLMPDTKELFLKIKPHLDYNITDVYAIEQSLFSDRLRVAGRVDCIAEWNGKLSVIDFKTSSREKDKYKIENYFMQCSAYAEMFEEVTSKKIDQIVVAISVEDGNEQIFVESKLNYLDKLQSFLDRYHNK